MEFVAFEKALPETPLPSSLLHSSHVPSAEDRLHVQQCIDEVQSSMISVDSELFRLRAALAELERHRDQLQTTLTNCRSVLSPIRSLPHEILREIFRCASGGSIAQWPFNAKEVDMPWCLGMVCSYWRTTALSLQGLWANIDLSFNMKPPPKNMGKALEFLGTCLARSGEEPLKFSVRANGAGVERILTALVAHSTRWMDVILDIERLFDYHSLLSSAKNRLPKLRKLYLGTSPSPLETVPVIANIIMDVFLIAPKLRDVTVSKIVNPFHTLRLPWAQITHYTSKFNLFREGEFVQILVAAPKLVSLSSERERVLEVGTSQPIQLPHLQSLTVINKGTYIAKTFQCLSTPSLASLTIDAITAFAQEDVMNMIIRSRCEDTLTRMDLSLCHEDLSDRGVGVLGVLMSVPNLVSLRLSLYNPPQFFMERLAYFRQQAGAVTYLPKLKALDLECRSCISSLAITHMMLSRMKVPFSAPGDRATLSSIKARFLRPPFPEFGDIETVRAAGESAGADIDIKMV